jgi:hypothetical protein
MSPSMHDTEREIAKVTLWLPAGAWPQASATIIPRNHAGMIIYWNSTAFSVMANERASSRAAQPSPLPGAAPWVPTYTAYKDWLAAINKRLRLGPPKQRLPQISGRRLRAMIVPTGVHIVTPL